jgi:DNA-binding transcriptional ArsR family regulator
MDVGALELKAQEASELLGAMANEKRLMILCQLLDGEKSVTELTEKLCARQSTISQHLAILRKDRLVTTRRAAQNQYYSLVGAHVRAILKTIYRLYCEPTRPAQSRSRSRSADG